MAIKGPKASTATAKAPALRRTDTVKTTVKRKRKLEPAGGPPLVTANDATKAPSALESFVSTHKKELAIVGGALIAAFILYRLIQGAGGGAAPAASATTTPDSGSSGDGGTTTGATNLPVPSGGTTTTTTTTTPGGSTTGQAYGTPSPSIVSPPITVMGPPVKKTPAKLVLKKDPKKTPDKHNSSTNAPAKKGAIRVGLGGIGATQQIGKTTTTEKLKGGREKVSTTTYSISTNPGSFSRFAIPAARTNSKILSDNDKAKGTQHTATASRASGSAGGTRTKTLPSPHDAQTVHKTTATHAPKATVQHTGLGSAMHTSGAKGPVAHPASHVASRAVVKAVHKVAAKPATKPKAKAPAKPVTKAKPKIQEKK